MRKATDARTSTSTSANAAMNIVTRPLTMLVPGAPWYTAEQLQKPKTAVKKKKPKPKPAPVIDTRILTWTKPKLKL